MTHCGIGLDGSREGWSIEEVSFDGPGSMAAVFSRKFRRFALISICLVALAAVLPVSAALAVDERSERASLSLTEKGVAALAAGELAGAQRLLEEAVVANPANARAYTQLAAVHEARGNQKLARKYYVIALSIDPVFPAALGGLAKLNIEAGDKDAAGILLDKLKLTCPGCTETRELERVLGKTGNEPSPPVESNP